VERLILLGHHFVENVVLCYSDSYKPNKSQLGYQCAGMDLDLKRIHPTLYSPDEKNVTAIWESYPYREYHLHHVVHLQI
jgi:hypothetical protein